MQGRISEEALDLCSDLIYRYSEDSFDFTRCVRPNGTVYGTSGKCRKGTEEAKVASPPKSRSKKVKLTPAEKKARQAETRARMAAAASRMEGAPEPKKESKSERRVKILKELKAHENTKPEDIEKNIQTLARLIKSNPGFRTPLTVNTLIALRALRMKAHLDSKKAQVETETQSKVPASSKQGESELLKQSPKYTQTPGSLKPLPKVTKALVLRELKEELEAQKKELSEALPSDARYIKRRIFSLELDIQYAEKGDLSSVSPPRLATIYAKQGFNAKPEVVAKRSDLEARSDIARNPDGRPIIAYRGVTTEEYSLQFKGGGPNGEAHFPGQGIYGDGSYAASSTIKGNTKHDRWAQETAISYSGGEGGAASRVTAFAFRSDANLAQTDEDGKTFPQWEREIIGKAERTTGRVFIDAGAAAAALGIHAYRIPQIGQDYWVVLNRGAIIVAEDPELPKDLQ